MARIERQEQKMLPEQNQVTYKELLILALNLVTVKLVTER